MTRDQRLARITLAVIVTGVAAIAIFGPRGAPTDTTPVVINSPVQPVMPIQALPHRDDYGNLVAIQHDKDITWTYSGPDARLQTTRAALQTLRHTCPKLTSLADHVVKVTASYVILHDVPELPEIRPFAGLRMVMVEFDFQPGAALIPGYPAQNTAAFIIGSVPRREIIMTGATSWFCNKPFPSVEAPYTRIPTPSLPNLP